MLFSSKQILNTTLVVQAELRFQPFYEGEPSIFKVGAYLEELGFEMIQLHPESWKYRTQRSADMRNGRLAFVDAVFFLSPSVVKQRRGERYLQAMAKQIIIACQYGYSNYAEYLLENCAPGLPAAVHAELRAFIQPASPAMSRLIRFVNAMARRPRLHPWIARIRRLGISVARAASYYPDTPHVIFW